MQWAFKQLAMENVEVYFGNVIEEFSIEVYFTFILNHIEVYSDYVIKVFFY